MIFERSTESCAPFFSAQNKKVRTNKHNNKSFVHLFKGGGFPKVLKSLYEATAYELQLS